MTIDVELQITINGAQVTPTPAQTDQIRKSIDNILFKEQSTTPALHVKRAYRKKISRKPWTADEIELAVQLRTHDKHTVPRVTKILNQVFGNGRSANAVAQILGKQPTVARTTGIFDNINPSVTSEEVPSNIDEFKL